MSDQLTNERHYDPDVALRYSQLGLLAKNLLGKEALLDN